MGGSVDEELTNITIEIADLIARVAAVNPQSSPSLDTTPETYVDFELHIASNGHVIAKSSQQGEVSADIATEPSPELLADINLIAQHRTDADLLKKVGRALYSWLFPSDIHAHLLATEAVARHQQANLRLRLRVEASSIARLPLEFLYRQQAGYFLAINPKTVLSRYLDVSSPPQPVRPRKGPLHLLAIIADPTDQPRLDPDTWENLLKRALAQPLKDNLITLTTVKRATRREIDAALLKQKPDIIQFVGHGVYRQGQGHLALVKEETGESWLVDEESFANLYLGYDDYLRLISLATCESAQSDDPQGFMGIAPRLVQRGIPAVVAMQYEVQIKTSQLFLEVFYTAVAARKPIDWAVQSARRAISLEAKLDNREFATPVLYMRAPEGQIFPF